MTATHILDIDALITAKIVDEVGKICRIVAVKRDTDKLYVSIVEEKQLLRLKALEYVVAIKKNPFQPPKKVEVKDDSKPVKPPRPVKKFK